MPDKVTLKLAHPLTADQAARVLADEVKDYWVGDEITVRRDYAMSIINAGYAARVDPADAQAVRDTLQGKQPKSADSLAEAAATVARSATAQAAEVDAAAPAEKKTTRK